MGVEHEDLQKMRSEQIHRILQQDEQLGREQSMFQDVGQMQANREVIDQALMKSGEWKLTDKEQYRLRAIQGRTISHLLLNQNQFSTDSPEMSLVKQTLQQLRTESGQMRLAKQMIEQGELPEHVQRQSDLLVAAQDYQGRQTAQTDAVAQPVGITALTYADFASMLGTHNRGQIEFAGNGLRMINNHALSVSSGTASEDHFLVREQLLVRAAEKLGEQACVCPKGQSADRWTARRVGCHLYAKTGGTADETDALRPVPDGTGEWCTDAETVHTPDGCLSQRQPAAAA